MDIIIPAHEKDLHILPHTIDSLLKNMYIAARNKEDMRGGGIKN